MKSQAISSAPAAKTTRRAFADLQGFGFTSFQQLEQDFHQTASGLDIVFDPSNDILLSGINQNQVGAGDFVFN